MFSTMQTKARLAGGSWMALLGLAGVLAMASAAQAQPRPYIGFVYPAGGQQGTTFQIRLGGQNLNGLQGAMSPAPGCKPRWSNTCAA